MSVPEEVETVKSKKVVTIADADGRAIRLGSVLKEIKDGDRGVVVRIFGEGDRGPMFACVGDILIQRAPGCHRGTNRYNRWRHIPVNEQTYEERFLSWKLRPHESFRERISKDEDRAIDGIMALLPDDIVDFDYGPFTDDLESALHYLVVHLTANAASPRPIESGWKS